LHSLSFSFRIAPGVIPNGKNAHDYIPLTPLRGGADAVEHLGDCGVAHGIAILTVGDRRSYSAR
jgi:hypothetical protein